jgi:hypothetical protein
MSPCFSGVFSASERGDFLCVALQENVHTTQTFKKRNPQKTMLIS